MAEMHACIQGVVEVIRRPYPGIACAGTVSVIWSAKALTSAEKLTTF
jgi:hypothetical protein